MGKDRFWLKVPISNINLFKNIDGKKSNIVIFNCLV